VVQLAVFPILPTLFSRFLQGLIPRWIWKILQSSFKPLHHATFLGHRPRCTMADTAQVILSRSLPIGVVVRESFGVRTCPSRLGLAPTDTTSGWVLTGSGRPSRTLGLQQPSQGDGYVQIRFRSHPEVVGRVGGACCN
jgi:hypothetical protein